MKPDCYKLMEEFEGHKDALIGDVDCTAAGEPLCQQHGVGGYPSLKWGNPDALEDYEGGRSFDELKEFAAGNLGPQPVKSELQKVMAQIERITKPLQADIQHVLQLRKNAAVLLMVAGILIGFVLGLLISRCCCSRAASVEKKDKDA